MPRMQILTQAEKLLFSSPPKFNHSDRKRFFEYPDELLKVAYGFRKEEHRVMFLLACGYFKATKKFFSPSDYHQRDIDYVVKPLYLGALLEPSDEVYSPRTRQRHERVILEYYGFKSFDMSAQRLLKVEVMTMAETYLKPRLIFDRSIDWLQHQRIAVPSLRVLSDIIRHALQEQKQKLASRIENHLSAEAASLLDSLFMQDDESSYYHLTLLKRLSQSTRPTKVREFVSDFNEISELYNQLSPILEILNLGRAGMQYYAGSVIRSRMLQLTRREKADRYVHAIAFVAHQYYRMQDNLIDILLNVTASFQNKISRQRQELAEANQERNKQTLKTLAKNLDTGVFDVMRDIRAITYNSNLPDNVKVNKIKDALKRQSVDSSASIHADISAISNEAELYDLQESMSLRLQNRLNPVLKSLIFKPEKSAASLMKAIGYFQNHEGTISNAAPVQFLTKDERKFIYKEDGSLRVSLYKVLLFRHVALAIKSGTLNLINSYKYRPLDDYLISCQRWDAEKYQLLERAELLDAVSPQTVLSECKERLHAQYEKTNKRVSDNEFLSFNADGTFKIKTPAIDKEETDPLQAHFPKRHYIPLAEILQTVDKHSNMLGAFEHWQQTHTSSSISHSALFAGIIGLGCKIGLRKMARISSHVTESELDNAVNWRFSLDNIRDANDRVLATMDKLELPNIYRKSLSLLHTASDGQKFGIRGESLVARPSFKYFGQGQGISVSSFIDERGFLWHSLIMSSADRESMGVIDGIMRNEIVKSDIHSTDTHGYNEAIFGITHMLGISFAPRLKGLKHKALYIFKDHPRIKRIDLNIKPDHYVSEKLIIENWDEFLRLVVTIKLKENTASDIFRRLNSYSKQHSLYRTVKAFGQIIKSLFILRYLDDVELRQAIEKQLNRVELANRFSRAVSVGNPREFLETEPEEQEIAESCNRLIKNSIICWNYLYLTHKLATIIDNQERKNLLQTISTHSIITWEHTNMLGEYDFSDEKCSDSVGITLQKIPKKNAL